MSVLPEDLAIFSLGFGTIVLGANQIKIRRKTPSGSLFLKDVKGQLLLDTFGNNKYKVKPGPLMERLGHFNDVHVKYNNNWDTLLTEAKKTIKMSSTKPAKPAKQTIQKSPSTPTKKPTNNQPKKSPAFHVEFDLTEIQLRNLCDNASIRHNHIKKSSTLASKLATHYTPN
jgi:hypothetical protein